MIFPFLDGFLSFRKIPVTWCLLILNFCVFIQSYDLSRACQERFKNWTQDPNFLHTQGQLYQKFLNLPSPVENTERLGLMAFRDESFLSQSYGGRTQRDLSQIPRTGESYIRPQVELGESSRRESSQKESSLPRALASWEKNRDTFLVLRAYYPAFLLGVSETQQNFLSFITYQFIHDEMGHLLVNLILLLIIGGFLETRWGGLWVLGMYLLGGAWGAFFYVYLQWVDATPLVGASGSVCALLGFLLKTKWSERTRLFYMIFPLRPYIGFVSVPTFLWMFWLFIFEDLGGVMAQSSLALNPVAHGVHLLGFGAGVFGGILSSIDFKFSMPS